MIFFYIGIFLFVLLESNSKPEGSLFDMEDDSKPTKKTGKKKIV